MKLLHLKIFIAVWAIVMIAGVLVPKDLLTAHLYTARVMSLATFLWICSCFAAFWMGTFIERSLYAGNNVSVASKAQMPFVTVDRLERILQTFKYILLVIAGAILFRFIWSIKKVGSLSDMLLMMVFKPVEFRFEVWQEATLHGIGVLSDAIVACTIFSFGFFALMKKYNENIAQTIEWGYDSAKIKKYRQKSLKLLRVSLCLFAIYFVLDSERLVLVMGILGGFLTYFLLLKRFPVKSLMYLVSFFLLAWIFVEGYLRSQFYSSETFDFVLDYAVDRLMLYIAPGLRNVDTITNYLPNHTYGWYTFNFIPTVFKLDFLGSISDNIYGFSSHQVVPGFAAIPVFGIAYADFGLASLLYFVVIGFIYESLHRSAILKNSFLALQVYSLFLVALIISFMPFLPTLARFWVNILTLVVINKSVRFSLRD